MFKYQTVYDAVYGHYYTEAEEYGVEWTKEHDAFVEEATNDLSRYLTEAQTNWYNFEAPTLPGLSEVLAEESDDICECDRCKAKREQW